MSYRQYNVYTLTARGSPRHGDKTTNLLSLFSLGTFLKESPPCSSVASFWYCRGGGAGGQDPKCTDRKQMYNVIYNYARVSEASEHLRNIYIFMSQNTLHNIQYTINAVPF